MTVKTAQATCLTYLFEKIAYNQLKCYVLFGQLGLLARYNYVISIIE